MFLEHINELVIRASIDNPLSGITPNFTVFGVEFNTMWRKVLGGIWAICIVIAIVFLITGITSMAGSSEGGNALAYKEGRVKAVWAGVALGCLVALGAIVAAIIAIAS